MRLNTTKGSYFVKIFAKHRHQAAPSVIVKAMELAMKAGISTPKVHRSKDGYLSSIKVDGHTMKVCVTDFIKGKTFWEPKERLSIDDIKFIARQAAMMNMIKYRLGGDEELWGSSWSRLNLPLAFKERGKYLTPQDRRLISPVVKEYERLKVKTLPRAFVHADIAKGNIIRDERGRLWTVDFSAAGHYPRILELGYIAKTMLIGKTKNETKKNIYAALKEYQTILPLTKREIRALPTMVKAMGAGSIIFFLSMKTFYGKDVPKINEKYLKEARFGLKQMSS